MPILARQKGIKINPTKLAPTRYNEMLKIIFCKFEKPSSMSFFLK